MFFWYFFFVVVLKSLSYIAITKWKKFKPMKKLNHNRYITLISLEKGEILIFHTFRMIGSSVVVTLWNILLTPANGTSFLVVTRS